MSTGNGVMREPTFPARANPPQMPRVLHPAAAEAAAAWSDMMHALEHAQAEVGQLKADLAVERRHVADLQRMLDLKVAHADRYQRYAIEARTHTKHIIKAAEAVVAIALEADACAMAHSNEAPEQAPERDDSDADAIFEKAIAVAGGGQ